MELIKDLPSIFEEFSEQRKNAFLRMHELKKQGKPFVGGFCTYLPKELPMAMGACMVGLCSKDGETIPDAEQDLPRNLCPLIKSSYGYAKTDKCPFFYFSDLIVGETASAQAIPAFWSARKSWKSISRPPSQKSRSRMLSARPTHSVRH